MAPLRAWSEHIPIVRALRAQGYPDRPHLSHSPITMSYVPKIVMTSEIK